MTKKVISYMKYYQKINRKYYFNYQHWKDILKGKLLGKFSEMFIFKGPSSNKSRDQGYHLHRI